MIFTRNGIVNIRNAKWKNHHDTLDPEFPTELCQRYNMSYLHHLMRCNELLGMQLTSLHNLTFYLWLMDQIREKIESGEFSAWYPGMIERVERRTEGIQKTPDPVIERAFFCYLLTDTATPCS